MNIFAWPTIQYSKPYKFLFDVTYTKYTKQQGPTLHFYLACSPGFALELKLLYIMGLKSIDPLGVPNNLVTEKTNQIYSLVTTWIAYFTMHRSTFCNTLLIFQILLRNEIAIFIFI